MGHHYTLDKEDPQITGVPFNDSYRFSDWPLIVPMLLMESVLVKELSHEEASQKGLTYWLRTVPMLLMEIVLVEELSNDEASSDAHFGGF